MEIMRLAWVYMGLSLILMALVPLTSRHLKEFLSSHHRLDLIINWIISGTILLHILPEAYAFCGIAAPILASIGFVLAIVFDASKITRFLVHGWLFPLVIVGLGLHGLLDGIVIRLVDSPVYIYGTAPLVVIHRIPASLYIWRHISNTFNQNLAWLVYAALGLVFFMGFYYGDSIQTFVYNSGPAVGALQALLAGGILHSAFHSTVIHHD